MRLKFLSLVACLLLFSATQLSSLHAQNNTGTIEGTVNDTSGRPLTDVTVQLTNPATDQRWTTTTDSSGFYRFASIPVGRYRLTTGAAGQVVPPAPGAPVSAGNIQAHEYEATPGGPVVVNLTVATPSTDHIISAETVPIRTNPATIQHTYNTESAQYWPSSNFASVNGKLFGTYNSILISEGVTSGDVFASAPAVAGQPPFGNNFRIRGVDNNNKVAPGPLVYVSNFATDSTNLFQNQVVPIFGHSIGGQTDLITRSGTNEFHGSVYDFIQASQLSATDQAAARQGVSKPSFTQNRLGLSIGFPVLRNRMFFFANGEYIPLNATNVVGGSVLAPTSAGFSTLGSLGGVSAENLALLRSEITSPATHATSTTTVGSTAIPLGFTAPLVSDHIRQYMADGGLDFNIRSTDDLHVHFVENRLTGNNVGSSLQTVLPLFQTPASQYALLANVSETHTFGSGALNEIRLGYNRWSRRFSESTTRSLSGFTTLPSIGISGDTDLMLGPPPVARNSGFNTYQISDVLSVNRGRHRFDLGMDALRYIGAVTNNPAFGGGIFGFSSLGRFLQDLPPDSMAFQGFGTGRVEDTRYLFEWFAQDRFQFSTNLQISLGVRYQYNTIPQSLQAQRLNSIASVPGVISFAEPNTQKSAVSPYVGFAYSPGGATKTVVRGSFGIHYQSLLDTQLLSQFTTFPPQVGTLLAGTNLGNTPGFLAGGGLKAPATPGSSLTQEQARSLTSAFTPNDQKLPYSMQWNLSLQRAVWSGFTVELKYLGSRDVDLPFLTTLNTPFGTPSASLPVFSTAPSQGQLNALPNTLNSLVSAQGQALNASGFTHPIFTTQPTGLSRYNAAAVNLNQRLSSGLQFLANYTWSHDYATSTGSMLDLAFGRQLADTLWDRRHHASIAAIYDVGSVFKNRKGIMHNVLADFVLSGGFIYEWPARLPVLAASGTTTDGFGASQVFINPGGTQNTVSPVTPLTNSAGQTVAFLTSNPSAAFTTAPSGTFGGLRQAISLSPVNNVNLSAVKRFSVRERTSFEVRGDAYNVVNHPQFTYAPITGLNATSFGFVPGFITGNSPVVPTLTVPGGASFNDPSRFFSSNPRVFQLALRVTW